MHYYLLNIKADKSLQKKQKRRKYQSVDHFMKDVDTMFNNAKHYNEDESQIYKDANQLQACPYFKYPAWDPVSLTSSTD